MDVTVKNLRKEFDRFPALHDVSLAINSGELIALLGPSGSGKTTLLRLIAGLEFPTSGSIYFDTEDASHKTVQERHIGFVFQQYALFRHMTVLENISFGLKVRPKVTRPDDAEIKRRALELLDFVQLSGLEKRYPSQLSGGQRQRVSLARALAIEPRILLLDEPFGALDAQVRKDLRRWLREVHDATNHTTIFVTHDQEEALELADRVVVMSQGAIEQVGTPDEIYDNPNSATVFSFIGESSSVRVENSNGILLHEGNPIGTAPATITQNGAFDLFFRPHDVDIAQDGEPALSGVITSVRRTAGTRVFDVKLNSFEQIELELPVNFTAETGEKLRFKLRKFKLFPA